MEEYKKKIVGWVENNRSEFFLLLVILIVAALFRLWRVDEYLPFLGDEGRDVRVVRRFLLFGDLMFVGPRTSIGDMYLGPLYYYFIAPWLALFRLSPTGPAVAVALLGTATVGFVWLVAREWFGKIAGLVAAFLYAISPLVVNHSKHSWNPNVMPFFALLSIYSVWRVWTKREYWWLLVLGVSYAFVLQSHYLGLLLLPTLVLIWFMAFWAKRKTENGKRFLVFSFLSFSVFLLLMSPLILFDYKHGWHNVQAISRFFAERQETVSAKPWNALPDLWPLWSDKFVGRIMIGGEPVLGKLVGGLLATVPIIIFSSLKSGEKKRVGILTNPLTFLTLWVLVGLVGLGLLKQEVYDHYFGFMFPAPFLLTGAIAQKIWNRKTRWLVAVFVAVLVWVNIANNPLRYLPQRQMQRVQEIDRKIIKESGGGSFNFGLVAKRNYEEGYLYFFELMKAPVRIVDPQHPGTITDQLFVVCEDLVCDNPVYSPKAEIAHFGMSKVEKEWKVRGAKLYKLIHSQ